MREAGTADANDLRASAVEYRRMAETARDAFAINKQIELAEEFEVEARRLGGGPEAPMPLAE